MSFLKKCVFGACIGWSVSAFGLSITREANEFTALSGVVLMTLLMVVSVSGKKWLRQKGGIS